VISQVVTPAKKHVQELTARPITSHRLAGRRAQRGSDPVKVGLATPRSAPALGRTAIVDARKSPRSGLLRAMIRINTSAPEIASAADMARCMPRLGTPRKEPKAQS
jgi:hypothetical protein